MKTELIEFAKGIATEGEGELGIKFDKHMKRIGKYSTNGKVL